MRIAQVAPLWESVPPLAYGGTERIVGLLTDELVQRGHDVTLFATGDSKTLAKLDAGCPSALRRQNIMLAEYEAYEKSQLRKVFSRAREFDLIHSHVDYAALPWASFCSTPVVHTLHGSISSFAEKFFKRYHRQNFISISQSQRRLDLHLNYVATVYNAILIEQFQFCSQPHSPPYLAFLGRMSVEKGPHLAIQIAKRCGLPLKMAGKIDLDNREFFEQKVAPHIDGNKIEFLGEVDHLFKNELLGNALATLFPITWSEPFGLVMAESMACGTPVIAMNLGAASEVIADQQTGYLCNNLEDCVAAISQVDSLDRQLCRAHVSRNFSVYRMLDAYENIYQDLTKLPMPSHFPHDSPFKSES